MYITTTSTDHVESKLKISPLSTMSTTNISAVQENLHHVFEETDATKRKAAIEKLWVKSEDAVFIDPDRIWRGHDEIDRCVAGLVVKFQGWVFAELGKCLAFELLHLL